MPSKEEDNSRPPRRFFCRICGREVPVNPKHRFCEEHLLHYEARQRDGVTTEELSARWGDTLDNWRERPTAVEEEMGWRADSTLLLFRQREGAWVLFRRLYAENPHGESRGPDFLAVQ